VELCLAILVRGGIGLCRYGVPFPLAPVINARPLDNAATETSPITTGRLALGSGVVAVTGFGSGRRGHWRYGSRGVHWLGVSAGRW